MLGALVLLIIGFGAIALTHRDGGPSDEELVDQYAQGDLKAFELLYQRHRKPIFNFILRSVHSPERAEEIMQEVFVRLVQNATGYVREAKFTTWLYTIARNLCIDTYRRNRNRKTLSLQQNLSKKEDGQGITFEGLLEDPKATQAGENRVFHQEIQEALSAGIQRLSEEQREVFMLREASHFSYQEIAEVVGVSENTIKSRMRYALEHLRKHMKAQGFSLEDLKERA